MYESSFLRLFLVPESDRAAPSSSMEVLKGTSTREAFEAARLWEVWARELEETHS